MIRLARALAAFALLFGLSVEHWPDQIDDLYISAAFAHEWVTRGHLAWTTGETVEGYSNFLWVVMLAGAERVGADPGLVAQLVSLASGAVFLGFLSLLLPETLAATLLVLACGAWTALGYWSMMGMETVAVGLLLTVGWVCVARERVSLGLGLLFLAALTRPEAAGHLLLGMLAGRRWRPALLVGASFGIYHLLRHAYFGAWIPTPTLIKIGTPGRWQEGLQQAGTELVSAAGIVLLAALAGARWWSVVPLAIQVAVLTRAGGDWMGEARLLVPGVMASVGLATVRPRAVRPRRLLLAVVGVITVASSWLDPRWEGRTVLAWRTVARTDQLVRGVTGGLNTPLAADVEFLVNHLPDPAAITSTDVGMPGNIPGLRVYDDIGLVDRVAAEFKYGGDQALLPILAARLAPVGGEVTCIRHVDWGQGGATDPDPETAKTYVRETLYYDRGQRIRVFCRDVPPPPSGTVVARWAELSSRFWAQPWLAWHHALALADDGRLAEALAVATPTSRRWPGFPPLQDLPDSLSFPRGPVRLDYQPSRGFALYGPWTVTSRPLDLSRGTVDLVVTPEEPGDEGVKLGLTWEGCPAGTERYVKEVQAIPLIVPSCATGRLSVSFLNDSAEGGHDRNVYVRVRDR